MMKICKRGKSGFPWAVISLSPNAPDFAYQTSLQDWPHWVKLGLLDEVVVQVYWEDLASLKDELLSSKLQALKTSLPISVGLYTGPFLSPKSAQQLQKEIAAVRSTHYNGVSFFCWETTFWLFKGSPSDQVYQTFLKLFPAASKAPNS